MLSQLVRVNPDLNLEGPNSSTRTLVLGSNGLLRMLFPIETVAWHKAIELVFMQRAVVVKYYGNLLVRSRYFATLAPAVIRMNKSCKISNTVPHYSYPNLLIRDYNQCQYCGSVPKTVDHFVPKWFTRIMRIIEDGKIHILQDMEIASDIIVNLLRQPLTWKNASCICEELEPTLLKFDFSKFPALPLNWENAVAACKNCNAKKGPHSIGSAEVELQYEAPYAPNSSHMVGNYLHVHQANIPPVWMNFLQKSLRVANR
ncbi:MAG: hypothetical protein OXR68_07755 [Alphaproteobacteria bacterium]|nr:hypothetical protein [Alphaproteobacteria bacterium]MDD9920499.1 hypothetical protein [Alphaproteobacteria bacterium]